MMVGRSVSGGWMTEEEDKVKRRIMNGGDLNCNQIGHGINVIPQVHLHLLFRKCNHSSPYKNLSG